MNSLQSAASHCFAIKPACVDSAPDLSFGVTAGGTTFRDFYHRPGNPVFQKPEQLEHRFRNCRSHRAKCGKTEAAKLHWPGLVVWGACPKRSTPGTGPDRGRWLPRTECWGDALAFRVLISVQSEAGSAAFGVPVAAGAVGCESGCLCALAPHGAGDCLPRHDPQSIALFPLRPGVFARRIGVVAAGRLQRGPRAANAGQSRIWATFRLHTS